MQRVLLLLIFVGSLTIGAAQAQTHYTDSLWLHDGAVLTGKIHRYNKRGNIILETPNRYLQEIHARSIARVSIYSFVSAKAAKKGAQIRSESPADPCDKPYNFKEKGLYNVTYGSGLAGIGYNNITEIGFGINHIVGYQWNRGIGTGIGIGLENFSADNANGSLLFPVYAEIRGYLSPKRWSPYYSLSAGYGIATKDEERGLTGAKGGFRLHPAFGVRMGARDDVNFLFDVGYVFQKVELTRIYNTWSRDSVIQDIWYKRLSIRLGIIF